MKVDGRELGPEVWRIVSSRMCAEAIPSGGGLEAGISFLRTPGAMGQGLRDVVAWWDECLNLVKGAPEPNPYRNASDEEIARAINERIQAKSLRMTRELVSA